MTRRFLLLAALALLAACGAKKSTTPPPGTGAVTDPYLGECLIELAPGNNVLKLQSVVSSDATYISVETTSAAGEPLLLRVPASGTPTMLPSPPNDTSQNFTLERVLGTGGVIVRNMDGITPISVWDGAKWSSVPKPHNVGGDAAGLLTGRTADDIIWEGFGLIWRWNGTNWYPIVAEEEPDGVLHAAGPWQDNELRIAWAWDDVETGLYSLDHWRMGKADASYGVFSTNLKTKAFIPSGLNGTVDDWTLGAQFYDTTAGQVQLLHYSQGTLLKGDLITAKALHGTPGQPRLIAEAPGATSDPRDVGALTFVQAATVQGPALSPFHVRVACPMGGCTPHEADAVTTAIDPAGALVVALADGQGQRCVWVRQVPLPFTGDPTVTSNPSVSTGTDGGMPTDGGSPDAGEVIDNPATITGTVELSNGEQGLLQVQVTADGAITHANVVSTEPLKIEVKPSLSYELTFSAPGYASLTVGPIMAGEGGTSQDIGQLQLSMGERLGGGVDFFNCRPTVLHTAGAPSLIASTDEGWQTVQAANPAQPLTVTRLASGPLTPCGQGAGPMGNLTPDGQLVQLSTQDAQSVFDVPQGKAVQAKAPFRWLSPIDAWDAPVLLSGDGSVVRWDASGFTALQQSPGLTFVKLSPKGDFVLDAPWPQLSAVNLATGARTLLATLPFPVGGDFALGADGTWALFAGGISPPTFTCEMQGCSLSVAMGGSLTPVDPQARLFAASTTARAFIYATQDSGGLHLWWRTVDGGAPQPVSVAWDGTRDWQIDDFLALGTTDGGVAVVSLATGAVSGTYPGTWSVSVRGNGSLTLRGPCSAASDGCDLLVLDPRQSRADMIAGGGRGVLFAGGTLQALVNGDAIEVGAPGATSRHVVVHGDPGALQFLQMTTQDLIDAPCVPYQRTVSGSIRGTMTGLFCSR